MEGWTPKTDFLLLHPLARSQAEKAYTEKPFTEQHGGFDIIDHAFGHALPSEMLNELQTNGWFSDPARGIKGKLKPARTKMDLDMDSLLGSFVSPIGDDDSDGIAPMLSKVGFGTRGDQSAFVPRKERTEDSFSKRYPLLHNLVKSIENTASCRLGKSTKKGSKAHGCETSDSGTYFKFDNNLTSVQIAKYPGDGKAGYPRHCDLGAKCAKEPIHRNENSQAERLLTFVYYLTPAGWDSSLDGGALRMHSPVGKNNNDDESDTHIDVTPYTDRLVVFRSDLIEHQVLPSLRRDRMAITVWLYGRICRGSNTERVCSPSSSFRLNSAAYSSSDVGEDHGDSSLPPPLPYSPDDGFASSKESLGDRTIFVAIPSYRDKETWPTIKSLVETARYPNRVYIGVVFQVDTKSLDEVRVFTTAKGSKASLEAFQWNHETNFRSLTLDYRHSTGPCFARYLCQQLHRGEDYVLQIDSHMRFRPNWDDYLIQQLNKTRCPEKSLLTAYPPGYEPPNGPGPRAETRATILVPWKFGQEDGMLRQKGRLLLPEYRHGSESDNIPCLLYAGGFNFFPSSLLDICPYDSKLHGLFFGEEISMAVRLYTHGVDLYAPPQTVCYHLWKRNQLRVRDDSIDGKAQRENSLEVVRMQLCGVGRGLGPFRSAEQFREDLGVDFEKQTLAPGCENAGLKDEAFVSQIPLVIAADDNVEAASNTLCGDDMSSVLKILGQFLNET